VQELKRENQFAVMPEVSSIQRVNHLRSARSWKINLLIRVSCGLEHELMSRLSESYDMTFRVSGQTVVDQGKNWLISIGIPCGDLYSRIGNARRAIEEVYAPIARATKMK